MIEPLRNLVQATSMLMTCVIVSVFVPPELIAPSNRTHVHVPPQYDWHHFPSAMTPYFDESTTSDVHVDPVTGTVIESKGGWFDWLNQPSTEPVEVIDTENQEQLPADDKGSWGFWGKTEEKPVEPTPEEPTEDTGASWWGGSTQTEEPQPVEPEPQGNSWWSTPEEPTKPEDDILPEPVVVPEPVYYEPPKPTPVSDEYPPEDFVARTIWTANMIYSKPELAWFRMTIDVVSLLVCIVLWYMCRSPKPEVNEELKRENDELKEQLSTRDEAHTTETENLEYKNELNEIQREEDQKGEEVPRQGAPDVQKPPSQVTQSAEATQPDTLSSATSVSKKPIPKAEDIEAMLKAEEEELLANQRRASQEAAAKRAEEEKQRQAEQARKAQEEEKQRQAAAAAEKRRQEEEARRQEDARKAEEAKRQEDARKAEEERQREAAEQERQRQAAAAAEQERQRQAEQARKAQEEEARRQEDARKAEEAKRQAEEERQRQAAAEQEKQRQAEQERQRQAEAEQARKAQEEENQRQAAEQEKQRLAAEQAKNEEEKLKTTTTTAATPALPQDNAQQPAARVVAVGMKAKVREHVGTIRFVGPTQFAAGEWVGVEFDVPVGKNDGTMQGVNYFGPIKPNHGLFIRKEVVQLVD